MKYGRGRPSLEQPPPADATGNRFATCRWRANPDNGESPYCTHRDVLPYAGMNGFNPEAWCPDCAFFKMRRGSRKQARFRADDL